MMIAMGHTWHHLELSSRQEAKENDRSPSVALLCAGLLKKSMVCELERVLQESDDFLKHISDI